MKKSVCFCLCSLSFYNGMWWPNQPLQQTANLNQRAGFNSTGIISCFLILCFVEEGRTLHRTVPPNSSQFLVAAGKKANMSIPGPVRNGRCPGFRLKRRYSTQADVFRSGRVAATHHFRAPCVTGFGHQLRRYRKNANLRRRTYHKKIQKHLCALYTHLCLPNAWHVLRRVERWIP